MMTRILLDIETGSAAVDAQLVSPILNSILAPFIDFPFYFLTLSHPRTQLLSWAGWLAGIWILFALIKARGPLRRKLHVLCRGLLATITLFVIFVMYCILVPFPQYRLKSMYPDEIFINLHSHTIYSHDAIVTPRRSIAWHLDAGFSAWAVTEHDRVGPAAEIQRAIIEKRSIPATAIPGQEVNFRRGHLNLLGITEDVDTGNYENLEELVQGVHAAGGAVIVPHYWAAGRAPFSMEDFARAGVDGFEIAGNASVPLTPQKQKEIMDFCRREGLVMLSGNNWHGWRNFSTAWTGFLAEGWAEMDTGLREREIIDALRARESGRFRVIGYKQRPASSVHRFFEPFTGMAAYFTSISRGQRVSWLLWTAALFALIRSLSKKRHAETAFWTAITLLLVTKSALMFNTWQAVSETNKVLPDASKALMAVAAATAVLAFTARKKT